MHNLALRRTREKSYSLACTHTCSTHLEGLHHGATLLFGAIRENILCEKTQKKKRREKKRRLGPQTTNNDKTVPNQYLENFVESLIALKLVLRGLLRQRVPVHLLLAAGRVLVLVHSCKRACELVRIAYVIRRCRWYAHVCACLLVKRPCLCMGCMLYKIYVLYFCHGILYL